MPLEFIFIAIGALVSLFGGLFGENKKVKNILLIIGALITICAAGYSSHKKAKDDKAQVIKDKEENDLIANLNRHLLSASDTINSIKTTLLLGKRENDSLKIALKVINNQNDKLITATTQIRRENDEHFIKNQTSIGDITSKFGYRHINQVTEIQLINSLKSCKCAVLLQLVNGNQESLAFRDQLARIFNKSGWQVDYSIRAESPERKDLELYVDKHDSQYYNAANSIYGIISLLGYKIQAFDSKSFNSHEAAISPLTLKIWPYSQGLN